MGASARDAIRAPWPSRPSGLQGPGLRPGSQDAESLSCHPTVHCLRTPEEGTCRGGGPPPRGVGRGPAEIFLDRALHLKCESTSRAAVRRFDRPLSAEGSSSSTLTHGATRAHHGLDESGRWLEVYVCPTTHGHCCLGRCGVRAFSVIADAPEEAGGTPAIPAFTPEAYSDDFAPPAMTQYSVKML